MYDSLFPTADCLNYHTVPCPIMPVKLPVILPPPVSALKVKSKSMSIVPLSSLTFIVPEENSRKYTAAFKPEEANSAVIPFVHSADTMEQVPSGAGTLSEVHITVTSRTASDSTGIVTFFGYPGMILTSNQGYTFREPCLDKIHAITHVEVYAINREAYSRLYEKSEEIHEIERLTNDLYILWL